MLPGRGLRPHQLVPSASHYALSARSGAARKFSSVPRRTGLSALPCRTSPLHSARWRTGATSTPNAGLSASSVRYGSWYAPWSWTIPPPADAKLVKSNVSEFTPEPAAPVPEPVVTSATPEVAPAGIDTPAIVDSTSTSAATRTVEDILGADPMLAADGVPLVDPTAMVSYAGNLKDLGLDYGWGPTALFEYLVENCYLTAEVGWAGSIALSALALRCGLFYFQVKGSDAGARLAGLKPALQPLMDQMEAAKRAGNDDKAQALKMKQRAIMGEVGGALWQSFSTPLLQMVLGFGAFRCLRGMTSLPVPGMSTEGWAWFTDLTVSDPFYVLPLATGAILRVIIKNGGETGVNNNVQQAGLQKQLQIIMPVAMTVITSLQPAGLQLYFVVSALLGGITSRLLRVPAVRRMLRIRQLPTKESDAVYSKVVKGEIKMSELRGPDGRIRYQAPNASKPSSSSSKNISTTAPSTTSFSKSSGINIKPGTQLPAHMRPAGPAKVPQRFADRDVDYGLDVKSLPFREKMSWLMRNYKLLYVWRRFKRWINQDKRDWNVIEEEARRNRMIEAAKKYELERKRRLEG